MKRWLGHTLVEGPFQGSLALRAGAPIPASLACSPRLSFLPSSPSGKKLTGLHDSALTIFLHFKLGAAVGFQAI